MSGQTLKNRMNAQPVKLFKNIAYVMYPVRDMKASQAFYEGALGLKGASFWGGRWVEYEIGDDCVAITPADEKHKAGTHGATVALEVVDLDAMLEHLKSKSVLPAEKPFDIPTCRGCVISDPDGNEIILHAKKA
jgi:catechol 2,3-dioxygenase-like lactoylglutathione lyase family enzyme